MPILLLVNLKGGVAKTTNAVAIAECFASEGYRTLLIDADHQCMAGEMLLGQSQLLWADHRTRTFYDLLVEMLDEDFYPERIEHFVIPNASNIGRGLPNLSVIPCSVRIDELQTNRAKARKGFLSNDDFLKSWNRRRRQTRKWFLKNYDFTIVDCPPSLALQVRFLLPIADGFIVPCVPDRLSVRGSLHLLNRLEKSGLRTKSIGTLWSLYREQNHAHRDYVERGISQLDSLNGLPKPFETIIPNAVAIGDASDPQKTPPTFKAKYTSKFATLFGELCEEIIKRTDWQPSIDRVESTAMSATSGLTV